MKISIILPIYNEEKNIPILYEELRGVLMNLESNKIIENSEIICVNDGSRDNSLQILKELAVKDGHVKIINFRNNFGQTAALSAGITAASGDLLIPMDADLQNDPKDILKFIEKINEGYSMVSGWRKDRKDHLFSRKIPSVIANWLIGVITGVKIHDYGCTIKAYKKEVIQGVNLYGEMHRFIAAYAAWRGGKVAEIVVNHRPRINGRTNYGISRTFRVILDLIVVKFLFKYMDRPIHFFGGIGFISLAVGLFSGFFAVFLRLFYKIHLIQTPLPIFSALFIMVGVQFIVMGVVAEMLTRIYYESQNKTPF
ncbi:MAG: glycosyltransferase family 2 protein, partial [Candidatus Magasanikbacteria bacterium]|nr:glycosyltransferase family 2 protein [Candidatus Magasanikbacteria bacterium]